MTTGAAGSDRTIPGRAAKPGYGVCDFSDDHDACVPEMTRFGNYDL